LNFNHKAGRFVLADLNCQTTFLKGNTIFESHLALMISEK